jgi:hypothetical protein
MDFLNFFNDNFWAAVSLISMITVPVTSAINLKFQPKKFWKQVVSWGVSFVLTVICYFIGMLHLSTPVWLSILFTGIISGLSSNGIYDIPTIKSKITAWIGALVAYKATKEEK